MINSQAKIGIGTRFWYPEFSNIGNCRIGDNCIIHSHVWIGDGVEIGNNVRIEAFSFIPPGVSIGDDVFIGPRFTATNDKYPPSSSKDEWRTTIIENGARFGASVTVLPGLTIGEGAMIGAGSVVTKNVPAKETWVGNPAHLLRKKTK